jgi:predicted AAA+ superfamily ATPase
MTIPMPVMNRLWRLVAHYHGQVLNYSKLAAAADLSVPTLKKYLAILEQTYMVRFVQPCEANLRKRLIKAPKIYLRDSGLLHALHEIESYDQLLGHPMNGASWEGFAMENLIVSMPRHRTGFIRTSNGAEVDLCMQRGRDIELFEFKLSRAPKPSRGFHDLVKELKPSRATIIAPVDEPYEYAKEITVSGIPG